MTNSSRLVLDNNVLISRLLLPASVPGRAFTKALQTGQILVSDTQFRREVLTNLKGRPHARVILGMLAAQCRSLTGIATIAGAIMMLARILQFSMIFGGGRSDDREDNSPVAALAMVIVAPIAAMLIQFAISRTREYSADAAAKKYTGTPGGLVSALQKLEGWSKRIPMDASPATAHMFIIKPFSGQNLLRLFSTHPSTEQRIARLQNAAA
jgi:hypothetical protein